MKIFRSVAYRFVALLLASAYVRRLTERLALYYIRNHWKKVLPTIKRDKSALPRLAWGTTPILNNKYFSRSLQQKGYESKTIMTDHYQINRKEDFDLYYEDILEKPRQNVFIDLIMAKIPDLKLFYLLDHVVKNYDIIHTTCEGAFLKGTRFWRYEMEVFKMANMKVVVMPYGGDYYRYSAIEDTVVRHAIQLSYPQGALNEKEIKEKVDHWTQSSDCFIPSHAIDGIGRWDVLTFSYLCIDIEGFLSKEKYSDADGKNGTVKVIHTPNHRGVKGTEFLIKAVNELKAEGLKIDLTLLEMIPNAEVMRIMREEADILAEQFVFGAYALSGIEGMVSGLPVLTNLDNLHYTRPFRLYSYLNECPILSTPIEKIKENLRILVKNPQLRKDLGRAGRKYVEKYHSYRTSQYMFGKIYDKIWYNKEVDLLNLFHPLNANSYNNQSAIIDHPLIENKIVESSFNTLER